MNITNHRKTLILAMSLILAACAGTSAKTSPGSAIADDNPIEVVSNEKPDPAARVCKDYTPTGTRIKQRTCATQAKWDELERMSQQQLDSATLPQTNNPSGE